MFPRRSRKSLLLSVALLITVWKLKPSFVSHPVGGTTPIVQGGEDEDQTARERRDYIRGEGGGRSLNKVIMSISCLEEGGLSPV